MVRILVTNILVGLLLGIEGIIDYRTKKINIPILIVGALAGLTSLFIFNEFSIWKVVLGLLEGLLAIGLSYVTREGIGYGDGLIIGVTGLILGWKTNLIVILMGVFICSITSIILLITRRADRKKRIPFVPFLAVSFLLVMFTGGKIV